MAFRASNILPDVGLDRAKQLALQLKAYLESRNTQMEQATTGADVVLAVLSDLVRYKAEFNAIAAIPGITTYAQDLENDQNYDVSAEFGAMLAAIDLAGGDIMTTFPKDGSGYLLEKQFAVDGTFTYRTFTAAELAQLRTRISDVIATIS